jgi:type IX secretion system PorP/SprF family membrane protein
VAKVKTLFLSLQLDDVQSFNVSNQILSTSNTQILIFMKFRKITPFLIGFCFFQATLSAQDLHFSQFYNQPLLQNPGQTGIFKGDLRAAGIYRSQWTTVPVSYQTLGASVDKKLLQSKGFLVSSGLVLANDKAGDGGLTWTQIGATASVAHALGANQVLSLGFGLGFAQRKVDITKLKFKNQWNGETFDPAAPNKETFGNSSRMKPTLSAGLNWHAPNLNNSRNAIDVGIGAMHINRPNVNLKEASDFKLPMRLAFTAQGTTKISSNLDAVAFAEAQKMAENKEIIVGLGLRQWLNTSAGKEMALRLTVASRLGDAFIPALQLEYLSWTVGVSYDVNTSDFDIATNKRGGLELAVVYRVVKAPPVKVFKSCPIF